MALSMSFFVHLEFQSLKIAKFKRECRTKKWCNLAHGYLFYFFNLNLIKKHCTTNYFSLTGMLLIELYPEIFIMHFSFKNKFEIEHFIQLDPRGGK